MKKSYARAWLFVFLHVYGLQKLCKIMVFSGNSKKLLTL